MKVAPPPLLLALLLLLSPFSHLHAAPKTAFPAWEENNPTSPALAAAKEFNKVFPTCGKSLQRPIQIKEYPLSYDPKLTYKETLTPEYKLLFDAAQEAFGNNKRPERFEFRAIQYNGADYLKQLLKEEIYWLEPYKEWTKEQKKTFHTLIHTIKKLEQNPNHKGYVGRYNFEPEVNSYFYAEINLKTQTFHLEILQRCD